LRLVPSLFFLEDAQWELLRLSYLVFS
jgi:hypothetical protein